MERASWSWLRWHILRIGSVESTYFCICLSQQTPSERYLSRLLTPTSRVPLMFAWNCSIKFNKIEKHFHSICFKLNVIVLLRTKSSLDTNWNAIHRMDAEAMCTIFASRHKIHQNNFRCIIEANKQQTIQQTKFWFWLSMRACSN